ncbi:MAG: hypothetical protein ACYDAR_14680 [Thermomicrobiales bacterium]
MSPVMRWFQATLALTLMLVLASLADDRAAANTPMRSAPPRPRDTGTLHTFGTTTTTEFPWDLAQAAQYVTDKGIHDNRMLFTWQDIQTNSGDKNFFDWSKFDAYLQATPGFSTLGIVGNNIDWTPQPCNCTAPTRSIDGMLTLSRPALVAGAGAQWSDWDIYVYKTVSRYGPRANGQGSGYGQNRVHTWEAMNEIDSTLHLNYTDAQIIDRGQKYGAILTRTQQIILLADPAAAVISCGISDYYPTESVPNETNLLPRTKLFIDTVATTGAYNAVSGFSLHPYWAIAFDGGLSMKRYLDNVSQELLRVTGRPIPLWLTEVGYISSALAQGCGPVCQTSFETEGQVMVQNLTQIAGTSAATSLYWFLSSPFTPSGGQWDPDSFALSKQCQTTPEWIDSVRGRAFYAFKRDVIDRHYAPVSYQTSGDLVLFVFGNGTNYLHILWSKTAATIRLANVDATTFAQIRTTDYLDNTLDIGAGAAGSRLTLTADPVYLTAPTAIPLANLIVEPGPPLTQQSIGSVNANCDTITGWACNVGDSTRPLTIGVFDGDLPQGKPIAYITANQWTGSHDVDQQIANTCGGYGNRSFGIPTPLWIRSSGPHTLSAYALNLDGSPASKLLVGANGTTFNCVNSQPPTRPAPTQGGPAPPPLPTVRPGGTPIPIAPLPVPPHR